MKTLTLMKYYAISSIYLKVAKLCLKAASRHVVGRGSRLFRFWSKCFLYFNGKCIHYQAKFDQAKAL